MDERAHMGPVVLDGTYLPRHPGSFTVRNLRPDQVAAIERFEPQRREEYESAKYVYNNRRERERYEERTGRKMEVPVMKPEMIANIGWVPLESIMYYYCGDCKVTHHGPPKLEIKIFEDHRFSPQGEISCSHCNEYLGPLLIEKDDPYAEEWKKYIVHDESGKFIPYSPEFIDERIQDALDWYKISPHNLHRFYWKANEWMDKGKAIGHIVSPNEIYLKVEDETIAKSIGYIDWENMSPNYEVFFKLSEIIKNRPENAELKTKIRKKFEDYKELNRGWFVKEQAKNVINAGMRIPKMSEREMEYLDEMLKLEDLQI